MGLSFRTGLKSRTRIPAQIVPNHLEQCCLIIWFVWYSYYSLYEFLCWMRKLIYRIRSKGMTKDFEPRSKQTRKVSRNKRSHRGLFENKSASCTSIIRKLHVLGGSYRNFNMPIFCSVEENPNDEALKDRATVQWIFILPPHPERPSQKTWLCGSLQ